jgi:Flp pilus assembly protein TadD
VIQRRVDELLELEVFSGMPGLEGRRKMLANEWERLAKKAGKDFRKSDFKAQYAFATRSNPRDPFTDIIAARIFSVSGANDEVMPVLMNAHEKAPNLADVHLNLCMDEMAKNRLGVALEHLRELQRLRPGEKMLPKLYAEIYGRQGLFEEAIPHIKWDLEMNPDNPALWGNLGMAQAMSGQYQEAIESYRQGTRQVEGAANNLSELALALAMHGEKTSANKSESEEVARRAVELEPESIAFRASLAVSLAWNGKKDEAEAEAARVAEMAAAQGDLEIVAKLRERMGEVEKRKR